MRVIEIKGFRFAIGQGYENTILAEHGENWLVAQIQKIIDILFKADARIEQVSIVFDRKLKKAAWFKKGVLCINLAQEDLYPALRNLQILVYTPQEIREMSRDLPELRNRYINGDESAGREYLELSELVLKFSS